MNKILSEERGLTRRCSGGRAAQFSYIRLMAARGPAERHVRHRRALPFQRLVAAALARLQVHRRRLPRRPTMCKMRHDG